MKMLFIDRGGIGSHRETVWGSLGFALLLLVSSETLTAQKPPEVLPVSAGVASVRQPAANQPAATAKTQDAAPAMLLTGITTSQEKGSLVVSATATAPVRHKVYLYENPSRLVVDLPNVGSRVPFRDLAINSGNVKKLRVGEFNRGNRKITRMVFDLEDGFEKYEVKADGTSVLIVFPEGTSKQSSSKPSPQTAERSLTPKPTPAPAMPSTVTKSDAVTASQKSVAPVPAPRKVGPSPLQPTAATKALPAPTPSKPSKVVQAPPAAAPQKIAATPHMQPSAAIEVPPAPAPKPVPTPSKPNGVVQATSAAVPQKVTATPSAQPSAVTAVSLAPTPSKSDRVAQLTPGAVPQVAAVRPSDPQLTVPDVAFPPAPSVKQNADASAFKPVPIQISPPDPPVQIQAQNQAPPPVAHGAPAVPGKEPRYTGTPLTLDLVDIALVDFFRLLAEEGGINVVMDPEIKGTLSMKVVKVPWDQIFEAALMNNGLDKQIDGNLVRIARKATLQEEAKQRESLKKANLLAADLETHIKRLNYAKASALIPTLVEQKSVRGTVVFDERTNSLVMTDLPSSIQKMVGLVETLDIPQPQVEIEARIVSATRDFARDIGVQFGFVQGNLERVTVGGPNTFGTIGGTRPSATPTSTFAAGNPRTGRGAAEGTSTQSAGVSTGLGTGQPAGNLNVNLPAQKAFGGLGLSVGNIFDTFMLDAAITAGENKGLAKLISQPKTVTTNNSPATITQGLRFPVQIVANNTVTVQFQNAALTLVATPQITYEGNIMLDLQIENNTPDFSHAVNGIPSIRTSESKTRVLVTDGGTTVIGGILIDNEETSEDRIPGLASLPGIGYLFKRSQVSHSTQEVLFFITPKVIK